MLFEYKANKNNHNDLFLTFMGEVKVCDSYYLSLDRGLDAGNESPEKIRKVLKRLLEQWVEFVENAASTEVLFLPYDFSDEYIGCLRCEVKESLVSLKDGYLKEGGYDFYPTDISGLVKINSYFAVTDEETLILEKADFIELLRRNIQNL